MTREPGVPKAPDAAHPSIPSARFAPPARAKASEAYRFAADICRTLRAEGHEAYFVGGCVRDFLLRPTAPLVDVDVATSASVEDVLRLFPKSGFVGKSFGVSLVKHGRHAFEVATFRKDGPYSDRRRPDSVSAGGLEDDARRRDFTMNALYFDPLSEIILDPEGGRADIERRIVRCVGDARLRLREDALRILRLFRFSANFDLALDPATRDAARAEQEGVRQLSRERLLLEMSKVAEGRFPSFASRLFDVIDFASVFDSLGAALGPSGAAGGKSLDADADFGAVGAGLAVFPSAVHRGAPMSALIFMVLGRLVGQNRVRLAARELAAWPVSRGDRALALRMAKLADLDRAFAADSALTRLLLATRILREEDLLSTRELVVLLELVCPEIRQRTAPTLEPLLQAFQARAAAARVGAAEKASAAPADVVARVFLAPAEQRARESATLGAKPPEVAFVEARGLPKTAISALQRLHELQAFFEAFLTGKGPGAGGPAAGVLALSDEAFVDSDLSAYERAQEAFRTWERDSPA